MRESTPQKNELEKLCRKCQTTAHRLVLVCHTCGEVFPKVRTRLAPAEQVIDAEPLPTLQVSDLNFEPTITEQPRPLIKFCHSCGTLADSHSLVCSRCREVLLDATPNTLYEKVQPEPGDGRADCQILYEPLESENLEVAQVEDEPHELSIVSDDLPQNLLKALVIFLALIIYELVFAPR